MDESIPNISSFYKKHLSLNLYKFNYEIGRKEYVVHGKAERRIKIIFDNHLQENVFLELENTENNVMVRKLRFTFISVLFYQSFRAIK
mgnify:CR=1 FL=1